jgi:hypothetical protein
MSDMGEVDGEVKMQRPKHEICLLRYAWKFGRSCLLSALSANETPGGCGVHQKVQDRGGLRNPQTTR